MEHIQSYFDIHKGKESWLKDMPKETEVIVFQLIDQGIASGQYALPGFRPDGDMKVSIPKKVKERERGIESKLRKVREQLRREE